MNAALFFLEEIAAIGVHRLTVLLAVAMLCGGHVGAQGFPHKPIRIVTSSPGGGGDVITRLFSPGLVSGLGQQVIIDNRSGILGIEIATRAPADGHTLLVHGSAIWLTPFLRESASYDPVRDLTPITLATRSPNLLVVHPALAAHSVKDLIALAKARPGELNYASISTGSSNHLAAELLKSMASANIVRVSYKTTATAIGDVIGGQVQLMFATIGAAAPQVKSGRLRALAVTSAERSPLLPALPTIAESGLPGYEASSIFGMFAPAKTPAAIIGRLNQETVRALTQPELRERYFNIGIEAVGSSPEQLAVTMKAEMARMGKVIRDAGIREQ